MTGGVNVLVMSAEWTILKVDEDASTVMVMRKPPH